MASIVLGAEVAPIESIEQRVLSEHELESFATGYGVLYKIPLVSVVGEGNEEKFVTETVDEVITFHKNEEGQITDLVYRDVYRTTK